MNVDQLTNTANAMVVAGKGILAADESLSTIKKRFEAIGVESTAETRRDYRELLFRSTVALENQISGVILFDETIRQYAKDGAALVTLIERAGCIPGIKVDAGAKPLALHPGEMVTEGLPSASGSGKWRETLGNGERTCGEHWHNLPRPIAGDHRAVRRCMRRFIRRH